LSAALACEPNVPWFEVAVHDTSRVCVRQGQRDLLGDLCRPNYWQSMIFRSCDQVFNAATSHVLGNDVMLPVLLSHVVNRDDVRIVTQPRHRLCLALDPDKSVGVQSLRLYDGKRHLAIQLAVMGKIDALSATFAKKAADDIPSVNEGCWKPSSCSFS
jgi:hypothetical protein